MPRPAASSSPSTSPPTRPRARSRLDIAALPASTRRLPLAFALASLASGCRAAALAYGPDPASARTAFEEFATAVEARFTNVVRAPKFANARLRIGRYAFAPSKLVNDTALWTASRTTRAGGERDLELRSALTGNQYTFQAVHGVPLPSRVGDERHLISLRQLGEDDWFWHTEVDHAIGRMLPARAADIMRSLFASAERPGAAVRADYRAAFPRTAQALGRLIEIDSIASVPQGDGSSLVALHFSIDGERLGRSFPAFGKYVRKYIEPAKYRFRLTGAGAEWFDAQAGDRRLTIRFRSAAGQLRPLAGGVRVMPDTLLLRVDAQAKIGIFSAGVTQMDGEFVHVATSRERGWAMRFTKEPSWHLPLIAERLLRSPLRRPFEGNGVLFRLSLRSTPEGQTLLSRTFDVAVRESAIMRFLGNLGFTAMSDYAGTVEDEENRFIAEAMRAMKADMAALK